MIRFFANHPTAANLLMILLIIAGAFTVPSLRRETFPEFDSQRILVFVIYAGASAEEMEEAVGQPIEDALSSINYLNEITTESKEGITSVVVEMDEKGDIDEFHSDIKAAISGITTLPEDANDPIVSQLNRSNHVVGIAINGTMSAQHLKAYCEQLKRKLKIQPEISIVKIHCFTDHQIQVRVRSNMLMQYGISINDIAGAITAQSLDIPAGSIESDSRETLLRFADKRRTLQEFEDIVIIGGLTGTEIKLGDIATIEDHFERDEATVLFNGSRAAYITVAKSSQEDSLEVYDAVERVVKMEQQTAPQGVKLTITFDLASIIRDRLQLVFRNGGQGLILVFFTMYLFFNLRTAFWVSMGLPVSFLGAVFLMHQIGYTLNVMTSLALLLSIGILMDDAIVIAENIAVHVEKGKTRVQAAIDGTAEVKNGVIASFLTTACVFIPLGGLEGRMGKVLVVIPVVLLFVLGVSLIEAFLILPHHLGHSSSDRSAQHQRQGELRKKVEKGIVFFREIILGNTVDAAIRRRYFTVGIVLMCFVISLGMIAGGKLKFMAFPDVEGDYIEAKILLPQGTPLRQTQEVVKTIVDALSRVDEKLTPFQKGGQKLVTNTRIHYGRNADANENGSHLATISVDLLENSQRTSDCEEISNQWRKETGTIPDVISLKFGEMTFGPGGKPIKIQFQGDDLNELKTASGKLSQWLAQFNGVYNVSDDMRPGKPEIVMKLKKGATTLGMNAKSVAAQVRSAFQGQKVNEIQVDGEAYEVDVRLDLRDRDSIKDLEYFHLKAPNGINIPVTSVADFHRSRGYARIVRINNIRTLTLQGDVDTDAVNTSEVIDKLRTDFIPRFKKQHPNIDVRIRGETERSAKTTGSMQKLYIIGIIGIFVLLSYQFKSYSEPFIILMAIPFALIGVIWGHLAMGISLSMPSLLGFVSLSGIVVNDSILLVEFIKNRRQEGKKATDAACLASRDRFRAVFLTSITTIAGLLPLLSETSMQAQMLIPIAVSMAFGLMTSTLLILIVIPCFYAIMDDFNLTVKINMESIRNDSVINEIAITN